MEATRPDIPDHAPHVLVVDDDRRLRDLLARFLSEHGYRVTTAASANEARVKGEMLVVDAIVLDVMMPRVDGWEMLRRVRERHGTETIPVVMFSGKVDAAASAVEEQGAQAFVGKPFDPAKLLESTKQLLRT